MGQMTLQDAMGELIGRDLASIQFVRDYIQFGFDGPCLTTLTLPSLRLARTTITSGDQCYADHLRSEIGSKVSSVAVGSDELVITFASGSALVVSLRDEDYRGPEAINYANDNGPLFVV